MGLLKRAHFEEQERQVIEDDKPMADEYGTECTRCGEDLPGDRDFHHPELCSYCGHMLGKHLEE